MDLYVWVMKNKGFDIEKTGYFLYCDGNRFTNKNFLNNKIGNMEFKMTLISYQTDTSWIENTLIKIKENLFSEKRPSHNERCEFGSFLTQAL